MDSEPPVIRADEATTDLSILTVLPAVNPPLSELWQYRRNLRSWHLPEEIANELTNAIAASDKPYLSWDEYQKICLFGKNGYYPNSERGWPTSVHLSWPEALVKICRKYFLSNIVEVGFGKGELIDNTQKQITHEGATITYQGVEKNQVADIRFTETNRGIRQTQLAGNIKDLSISKPTLIVFPYSLSSMTTRCFTHIGQRGGPINAEIGIQVIGDVAREVIVPFGDNGSDLVSSNIQTGNASINIEAARLDHGQRAYLPLEMATVISEIAVHVPPRSRFLIIDEFGPGAHDYYHHNEPRTSGSRLLREDFLSIAGKIPIYTPIEGEFLYPILDSLGLRVESRGRESVVIQKFQNDSSNATINRQHDNGAILTSALQRQPDTVQISWSPQAY